VKKNLLVSIVLFLRDIKDSGFKVWVQERLEEGPLFGLWEFPGGKIETGETPEAAARREVHEEVGFIIPADSPLKLFKFQPYETETKNICLYVFICPETQIPKEKGQWFEISYESKSVYLKGKIPPINHVILDDLAVYIQNQHKASLVDHLWKT
jgi:8-oxo-dGTP diphosphatase